MTISCTAMGENNSLRSMIHYISLLCERVDTFLIVSKSNNNYVIHLHNTTIVTLMTMNSVTLFELSEMVVILKIDNYFYMIFKNR